MTSGMLETARGSATDLAAEETAMRAPDRLCPHLNGARTELMLAGLTGAAPDLAYLAYKEIIERARLECYVGERVLVQYEFTLHRFRCPEIGDAPPPPPYDPSRGRWRLVVEPHSEMTPEVTDKWFELLGWPPAPTLAEGDLRKQAAGTGLEIPCDLSKLVSFSFSYILWAAPKRRWRFAL